LKTLYLDKLGAVAGEITVFSMSVHWAAKFMIKQGAKDLFNKMLHTVIDD